MIVSALTFPMSAFPCTFRIVKVPKLVMLGCALAVTVTEFAAVPTRLPVTVPTRLPVTLPAILGACSVPETCSAVSVPSEVMLGWAFADTVAELEAGPKKVP